MNARPTPETTIWHIDPACVGSAGAADPDDDELLEAAWAAAHQPEPVDEWQPFRAVAEGPLPSVLYVEEAEVLVYADAVRTAVEAVRGLASEHAWLPVTVAVDGADAPYWVLHCTGPDVALADGSVDPALAHGRSVVHYLVGDGFPAFDDAARAAITAACPDVRFDRADPGPVGG